MLSSIRNPSNIVNTICVKITEWCGLFGLIVHIHHINRLIIHVKLTGIRLYLRFSEWFRTKQYSFWFQNQLGNGKYNLIPVNWTIIKIQFLRVYSNTRIKILCGFKCWYKILELFYVKIRLQISVLFTLKSL